MASLTNIFEGDEDCQFTHIYMAQAMQLAINLLDKGSTQTQEAALTCIASISGGQSENFNQYLKNLMPKFFFILKNCNKKEQKNLRALTLETITLIASNVQEQFKPYVPELI